MAQGLVVLVLSKNEYLCLSTCELLEKRIKFQKYNNICDDNANYICGDLTSVDIQSQPLEI